MAQQTVLQTTRNTENTLDYFLKAADFFLKQENRRSKFDGHWTFKQIDGLLRKWAVLFDPKIQKDSSFEEVVTSLKEQLAKEDLTQIGVPAPLLDQLEKNYADRQKQLADLHNLAALKADQEIRIFYLKFLKKDLLEKLAQPQIPQEKRTAIADSLSTLLLAGLEESDLPVLSDKLEQTPSETKQSLHLKEQFFQRFSETWHRTASQTAEDNRLSTEEKAFLFSLCTPVLQTVNPVEVLKQIRHYQQQLTDQKEPEEIIFFQEQIRKLKQRQTESIAGILAPPLTSQQADFFTGEFLKYFPDNLTRYEVEEAVFTSLWQMIGSEVVLKPEEVVVIANYRRLSPLPKQTENLLQLKNDQGLTVFAQIKHQLLSGGINSIPESDHRLTILRFQVQAIEALYKGLDKKDIEIKIANLLKAGSTESSPVIRELRGVNQALEEIGQKAKGLGFLEKRILRWQKKEAASVSLTFLPGIIIEKSTIVPKGRLRLTVGNPFRHKGLPAVQPLYAVLVSLKQQPVSIFSTLRSFLPRAGKQFGFLTAGLLQKILPPKLIRNTGESFAGILSGQNRTVNTFVLSTGNLLSGITNPGFFSDKGSGKAFSIGITAISTVILLVVITVGGAFTSQAGPASEGYGPGTPGLPAHCQPSRHYAEEVVCVLKDCRVTQIIDSTVPSMQICIEQSSLQGKNILKEVFSQIIKLENCRNCDTALQCVGFVDGIQKAIGKDMGPQKTACLYFTSPPLNYDLISGTERPKVGDVVVWSGPYCKDIWKKGYASTMGHLGIVIEVSEDTNEVRVAQADGFHGQISIRPYSFGDPENTSDPNGFLRYKVSRF